MNDTDGWSAVIRRLRAATAGEFEIVSEIGRGGMAAVYLARETALDRNIAMKVMSPALLTGAGMISRFQREARTVAKLVHPNIVTIHAVRQVDDLHFFTMQFVEGRSLDHIVHETGALPVPMVRGLLFTIGNALAYAHRRGVVHRDVKPANILISEEGSAVVTDFGIAKVAQDPSTNTQTNGVIGTPAYISPEQCYCHPATAASDQYSLGIVAYELLTGNPPFSGSSFAVMQAHTERAVPSICAARPDCPPELERAILRMLDKEPASRWPTMQHALAELGATPLIEGDEMHQALVRLAIPHSTTRHRDVVASAIRSESSTDADSASVATPPPYIATVGILAPPEILEVGDTIILSASARNASGSTMPGAKLTWSVDNTDVVVVDPTGGIVFGLAPGDVTITVTAENAKRSVHLRVIPRRVTSVVISLPPGNLHVGDRVRLAAKAEDKIHQLVGETIRWLSGDDDIIDISDDGVLTATQAGSALVWAEAQGVRTSARIDVMPAAVASLRIAAPSAFLEVGQVVTLDAVPLDGRNTPLAERRCVWSSSDSTIATITRDGQLTARNAGMVRLTCTCEGKSALVSTTVIPAASAASPMEPAAPSATMPLGVRRAVPEPHQQARRNDELEAPSLMNRRAVAVSAVGVLVVALVIRFTLLGAKPATSTQAAAAETSAVAPSVPSVAAATGARAPAPSQAPPPVVKRIGVTGMPATVTAGDAFTLVAQAHGPSDSILENQTIRWRSTSPSIATIDAKTGHVLAKKDGETILIAESDGISQPLPLTVAKRPVVEAPAVIHVAPTTAMLRLHGSLPLAASTSGGGPSLSRVSWSSDSPAIVQVDTAGRITGISEGAATILARWGPASASVRVTVGPAQVAVMMVTPPSAQMVEGDRIPLVASVRDDRNNVLVRPIAWRSGNPEIATVDDAGNVVARRAGSTSITARADDRSTSVSVVVSAKPTPIARESAAPASTPTSPVTSTPVVPDAVGADRMLAAKVADFVAALNAHDSTAIKGMIDDPASWAQLEPVLKRDRLEATEAERSAPQINGAEATMEFKTTLKWRTAVRTNRDATASCRATLHWRGGAWVLQGIRILNTLK